MKVVVLLLALLAVLGHAWLAHEWGREQVETLLEESLRTQLEAEPQLRGVEVHYDYLDGMLSGELPSKDTEELAQAFAEEMRLAGRISSEIKLGPPPDQPAHLTVLYQGGTFLVTGKLPDDLSCSAVGDELRLLGRGEVKNEIEISNRVIRPKWDGVTNRMFEDFFREPGDARVDIVADEVRLKRRFEGGDARRKELLASADPLKNLGMKVVDELEIIRSEPVDLTALRTEDGKVKISGELGDAAERDRLLEPLRPLLAQDGNGLGLRETIVPAEWAAAWGRFLADYLRAVAKAQVKLEGNSVVLQGELPGSQGKGDWASRAKTALGPGSEVEDRMVLVPDIEPHLKIGVEKNQVRIEGALPKGEVADSLAQAVKSAGFEGFESKLKTDASVKPPRWGERSPELIAYALKQAGKGLQPSLLSFQSGLVTVHAIVQENADREQLLALAKGVVPESWTLEFAVDVKALRSPALAGEVKDGGGSLRGLLPAEGLIEELRTFAKNGTGKPLQEQLTGAPDVRAPAWKGKLTPFLAVFFREVKAGSFELGDEGWVLAGTVSTEEAKRQILAEAEKVVGPGMPLRDGLRIVPPAEPFLLVALQQEQGWQLSGRVPDEASRQSLKSALPPAGMQADQLKVVPAIAPPPWLPKLPSLLQDAGARLTEARIRLEGNKLTLEGKHRKMEGKAELLALAKASLGETVEIDDKTWVPKPPTTLPPHARISLQQGRVVLTGELGDPSAGEALVRGARSALPKGEVVNELRISPQFAAAPWAPIVGGFLPSFAIAILEGEIDVAGQQITLRGKAKDESSRDALLADFAKALPNDLTLRDELETMAQPSAADRADTFTLYFGSASTFINTKAKQTLLEASTAIKAAEKKPTILIKGYADARGDEVANLELSRDRAEEVYRELVKAGVDAKQLEFIGVGETESQARSRFDLRYDRKVEIKLVR